MGMKVTLKGNESVEALVRRFKKGVEKGGIMREIRKREFFEKPSDKARRERLRRKKNQQREARMRDRREKNWEI